MKVTSQADIEFPKLGWSIRAGETKDLPEDKEAQKIILANGNIAEAGGTKKGESSEKEQTKDK